MSVRDRIRRLRQRYRAEARKGSAAIEFAFIMPIFLVLLLGIFESAIMFFSQSALQSAMTDMGRLIRTGQTSCYSKDKNGNCVAMDAATFRTVLCSKITPLIPCNGNLQVDIESFNSYTVVNPLSPTDGNKNLDPTVSNYNLGNACDVVLARAFYVWPLVTPGLTWFLVNADIPTRNAQGTITSQSGAHLMIGATAFRNEPFNAGTGGC